MTDVHFKVIESNFAVDVNKCSELVQEAVAVALQAGMEAIAADAGARCPRGTTERMYKGKKLGHVADSYRGVVIRDKAGQLVAQAGSDDFRARFIEFGTQHMTASPHLIPAAEAHEEQIMDEVKRLIAEALP